MSFKQIKLYGLLLASLCGCSKMSGMEAHASVVGKYKGTYFGGIEEIQLNSDGSFTQLFKEETGSLSNKGIWRIDQDDILFEPFLFLSHDGRLAPRIVGSFSTSWSLTPNRITMSEDDNYYVQKVP